MLFTNNNERKEIQVKLISLLEQSSRSLKIAVTWFTNHDLFDVILRKLDTPGYTVELIVLNDRINNKEQGLDFQKFIDNNGDFYYSDFHNIVHHKFCIIDDFIVVTGSYNWTYYAEHRNWENIILIDKKEIVLAYIREFDRIKNCHERIDSISNKCLLNAGFDSGEYLQADYMLQAQNDETKGDLLSAARVYTEIIKVSKKNNEVQSARTAIVSRLNLEQFTVCPFEIGIVFADGYRSAIPAFTQLPITVVKGGLTPADNVSSLQVIIRMFYNHYTTLAELTFDNLKPCPKGTKKIEHTLSIDLNGMLMIVCNEVNGYNRVKKFEPIDLKLWARKLIIINSK